MKKLTVDDLEPFIGMFDGELGFIPVDESIADPERKAYKVVEVGKNKFNATSGGKHGEHKDLEYWPKSDAEIWWTDGMQKWIANELVLVSDGTDDYIYVFYYKQNNRKYASRLGRLRLGSEIDSIIKEAFGAVCV